MPYSHITLAQLRTELANRLDDPSMVYWTSAELNAYLNEALRVWQSFANYWRDRMTFPLITSALPPNLFYDLTQQPNSLLSFNVKDTDLVSLMLYHLVEPQLSVVSSPPTILGYVGSDQFQLADFTKALERRRNQFLAETGMMLSRSLMNWPSPPIERSPLADRVIDVRRIAWLSPSVLSLAQLALDNFSPVTGSLETYGTWTHVTGENNASSIGGAARGTGGDCEDLYTGFSPWPNDQYVQATVAQLLNSVAGDMIFGRLAVRGATASITEYRLEIAVGPLLTGGLAGSGVTATALISIIQMISGTPKTLNSGTFSVNAGDVLTLATVGKAVIVLQNGTVILSANDNGIASGIPGLGMKTPGGGEQNNMLWSAWRGGSAVLTTSPNPYTHLWRSDEWAAGSFKPGWVQKPSAPPSVYSLAVVPPVTVELIPPPADVGQVELLTLSAGTSLDPTTGVLLGIPDDFSWVIKYGALADILSKEGQAKDTIRAEYCDRRWKEGIDVARAHTSVEQGYVDGKQVFVEPLVSLDSYQPGWQNKTPGTPSTIAIASWNMLAISPPPDVGPHSVLVDVLRNAPLPVLDTDNIQVGREELDAILDYAQHIASFKMGGEEFAQTMPLYERMVRLAGVRNERLKASIPFLEPLADKAMKEEEERPRRMKIEAVM